MIADVIRLKQKDAFLKTESNPYTPPRSSSIGYVTAPMCQRRIDVALLVCVFVFAFIISFIPSLDAILMPRFGSTLGFFMFPTIFLGQYLYRPTSKSLWVSAFFCLFVAAYGGYSVFRMGTVDTITNPYIHRLPSSYYFSVLPALTASVYLATLWWFHRGHLPFDPTAAKTDG